MWTVTHAKMLNFINSMTNLAFDNFLKPQSKTPSSEAKKIISNI